MTGQRHYGGAVWTNHSLERLGSRGLTQERATQTFNHSDKQHVGKKSGTTEFVKRFGRSWVTVIAGKNDRNEWVILSCWINPPLPGTEDEKKRDRYFTYHRAGFWGKVWLIIKEQLGF